ncbi:MAG: hypothetical protein IJR47_02735 [Clostridia bacterium]|nr:hypothetical protein [Clostridia bacterium]
MLKTIKHKRILCILAALTIGFVLVLSTLFIVLEHNHNCTEDNHCPTCILLEKCALNLSGGKRLSFRANYSLFMVFAVSVLFIFFVKGLFLHPFKAKG